MRAAHSNISLSFRAIVAALLTLLLLSSAVPFTVLSAAHSCSMPCCAGAEGSCATGACKGALFKSHKKSEEEKLCGTEGAHQARGAKKISAPDHPDQATMDSDHCGAEEKEPSTPGGPEASREEQTASTNLVSARSLASPCPKDCCTAASASAQLRRWRDVALLLSLDRVLPPVSLSLSIYSQNLPPIASAYLKRRRARGPPLLLSSDSV